MGRVAITGTASFLGGLVLERLIAARGPLGVVAVDTAPLPARMDRVARRAIDIAAPGADQRIGQVFLEDDVDTVVHAAFFTNPRRDAAHAHEVESIGTMNVIGAAAASGVSHFVMRSFTLLYGAGGRNPSLLTEAHPLRGEGLAWVRDKSEAEQHAVAFARRYPGLRVSVLRLAPLLGRGVDSFYSRLLARPVVPVLLGYDPLIQLLHPDDASDAFMAALESRPAGAVNVVPRDALSLKTLLHLADRVTVALPHPLAYAAADLLWTTGFGEAPGGFVDYARFPCVADGDRALREMAFSPRHGTKDALFAFLGRKGARVRGRTLELRA